MPPRSALISPARLAALLGGLALASAPAGAQQAAGTGLTIDRVFRSPEFNDAPLPAIRWLPDGRSWLELRTAPGDSGPAVVRVDARTGAATTLVSATPGLEDVEGAPGGRLLLAEKTGPVEPHKSGGTYFVVVFDSTGGGGVRPVLRPVSTRPGAQQAVKVSPDGRQVGFVRDHDLWVTDLARGEERRLTTDGSATILNGISDWVYDEELDLEDAWRWSPDGTRILFLRFDQSRVPEYPMIDYTPLYPKVSPLRHPKAGETNASVTVGVIDLASCRAAGSCATRWIPVREREPDLEYVPRIEWLGADSVLVTTMPRHQDRQTIRVWDAAGRGSRLLLEERDSAFVDLQAPRWLAGERQFLWLSDRSGWRQLYLYDRAGRVVRRVTADGVDVTDLQGVDDERGEAYVQVAEPDPTQRQLWRFRLRDGRGTRLTSAPGSHTMTLAPGAAFATVQRSRLGTPPVLSLLEPRTQQGVRVLADNAKLVGTLAAAGVRAPQFFRLPAADGTMLDAWRIVPADFDSTRAYPVLMYVYGGPSTPTVLDQWGDKRFLFHQMLAQRGYVVVSVDGRSSAWRGRAWRKAAWLRLGTPESDDQLAAARWLGRQPWVDAKRIGVWGRSYGGFMTALELGRGGDLFKAGLAIVPVTDWRYYDTIYTERYMHTPAENPGGYRATAPMTWAEGVTGRLLVLTSTGDDNVHAQNAFNYAQRLTALGKPFDMMLYLNDPHGLSTSATRSHWYDTMYRFVLEQL